MKMTSCLVAMAGLPGTGKSTLARALARDLGGVVLDKDVIRAALFPPALIEYSSAQDDFCMSVLFQTARYLVAEKKTAWLFVDGRPFGRASQINLLAGEAAAMGCGLKIILCVCSDASAKDRLFREHIAANRDYKLYQALQKEFEPISLPHFVADTDRPLPDVISATLAYLRAPASD
ncbi:MAG TPA: ATP-binding protein [Candidatus Angelobacter sp.]|nr:ATP-binding protein [Candidatus Angelobacter sp.]